MRGCLVQILVLSVALGACGGGSTGREKPPAGAAQIAGWEDATRTFATEFQNCGRRIYPTRHFYAACMKRPFADYEKAAAALRRACKGKRLNAVLDAVGSLQRREVRLSDAPLDAELSHRRYRGPPLGVVETGTHREIELRIAAVQRLGAAACTAR